jgi:hypothetical protein
VGVLLPFLAAGFVVYTMRRFGFFPPTATPWLVAGGLAGIYGVLATWRPKGADATRNGAGAAMTAWATAAGAIVGWQCLLSAYTELPEKSSYKLVTSIQSLIGPQTELFTIGQYRETLSPYLQRTLTPVQFQGELEFGLSDEPGKVLTDEAFLARWNASTDAVAFIAPGIVDQWQKRGLVGRVIGGDNQTLVVSRQ